MLNFEKQVADVAIPSIDYIDNVDPLNYSGGDFRELAGYDSYRSLTYSADARKFRSQYVKWSPDLSKLLPDETAAALDIPLYYRSLKDMSLTLRAYLGGTGHYKGLSPLEIVIDPRFNQDRLSFAHEIGHYFIQEVLDFQPKSYEYFDEERFCDYFARTLVVNESMLDDIDFVDENVIRRLIKECDVDPHTVILRLIEAGKLPDNVHIDSYTNHDYVPKFASKVERSSVCLHCSINGGSDCPNAHLSHAALLDFTDRAWAAKFSHCSGEFDLTGRAEGHAFLTEYYQSRMSQLALFAPMAPKPYQL